MEEPKGYSAFTKGKSACFLVEIPFQLTKENPKAKGFRVLLFVLSMKTSSLLFLWLYQKHF
ncbi:hypothetical protein AWN68_04545 [Roseivirga echinicomitans]|uniref:Uncharacterized protein n=1 Tax=Roseivirga echinicomitans TaxID=296218 RepID=A0A150XJN8_9BACT|nr:hypothetical protein AWN68_04545 [Roseivirga echinicomitans]